MQFGKGSFVGVQKCFWRFLDDLSQLHLLTPVFVGFVAYFHLHDEVSFEYFFGEGVFEQPGLVHEDIADPVPRQPFAFVTLFLAPIQQYLFSLNSLHLNSYQPPH